MDRDDLPRSRPAGEASPPGRHLPEIVLLTAAHVHDFARLFLQETPPGKGGDQVAPYLTYTLSTFGGQHTGCGSGILPWGCNSRARFARDGVPR